MYPTSKWQLSSTLNLLFVVAQSNQQFQTDNSYLCFLPFQELQMPTSHGGFRTFISKQKGAYTEETVKDLIRNGR